MIILSFSVFTILLHLLTAKAEIVNKNVERIIDLTSQLAKISITLTLENAGEEKEFTYLLALEPDSYQNLSYMGVKDAVKVDLKVTETRIDKYGDKLLFSVELSSPIPAGRTAVISVELVYSGLIVPYPSSILQKDEQRVLYKDNHYFYTPYLTTKQVTSLIISTHNIENYSKLTPVTQSDATLTYGPYNDINAFSLDPLSVHFESNAVFLTVTRLERTLDVSHWGSISIQENIDMLHTGAKLKGSFSRYDFQREREIGGSHSSIKSYKTVLPTSASSIYYRDTNGNISTSQVRIRSDWIELELRPRYPLFGGWKTFYTLGYDVPGHQYLQRGTNNRYQLRMRFIDNVFDDMHVAELETTIILPVGVTDIELITPYSIERLPDAVTYKYLDTVGRPVIRLKKSNLVEQHIQDFEISYTWKTSLLFHEPVLLSLTLYLMFLVVIIYVRLDFSIYATEEQLPSKKEEHVKTS